MFLMRKLESCSVIVRRVLRRELVQVDESNAGMGFIEVIVPYSSRMHGESSSKKGASYRQDYFVNKQL